MGVRGDAEIGRNAVSNVDDGAPLGKTCPELPVFGQALAQAVQTLGHGLARKAGQRLGALVHLDPGNDPGIRQEPRKRHSVPALLPQGLVEQDDSANVLRQRRGREKQLPVAPA